MKKKYILIIPLALFCATGLGAEEKPEALIVGREYHLTFEDGESIRNATVLSITESNYEIQIRGLTERIKVERNTVVSAERVKDEPPSLPVRKPIFYRFELQALADFHASLAALQKFDPFFPGAGVGFNVYLAKGLPFVKINAFHAGLTMLQMSDGERTISALTAITTARYTFAGFGIEWYGGAGGGIAALALKSYSFDRTSYAMLGRVEFGGAKQIAAKWRISLAVTGTYWQDNLELLMATGGQIALAYVF